MILHLLITVHFASNIKTELCFHATVIIFCVNLGDEFYADESLYYSESLSIKTNMKN